MVQAYLSGESFVQENKMYLSENPYLAVFFLLDAHGIEKTNKKNYAVRVCNGGKTLLAMKLSPFSLLLYGDAEPAEELFAFLLENDYDIGSLLGSESVCDYACEILRDRFGVLFFEALAMDFMEAKAVTEPSDTDIEVPTLEDVPELVECTEAFIRDCGLKDPVNMERIRSEHKKYRILRQNGKIAAMAKISPATENALKITDVYTREEFRGKGFARRVVNTVKNEILAQGKAAALNVDKKNPVTNHLYRSLGFERVFSQGEYRRVDRA